MTPFQDHFLHLLANPRSVAFFGASNHMSSMGGNLLDSFLAMGFEGPVYPVHPRETEVLGLKAYQSALDLPEIPDLAVIVVHTQVVPRVLEECGRKGIRRAIIISGGFREADHEGSRLEQELLRVARRYGIRFLGPNCISVANPRSRINTTFLEHEGSPGFVGMATQSGSLLTQMFHYLARHGMGFSTAFSVGNEADVDLVDCLQYLGSCPETKVIALYLEGIRRGREFIETARTIVSHKPVVVFYVGGSDAGRRASLSHTGAMAGPDPLYSGVFQQAGILRARSVTELFDFCWALGNLPIPKGNRVVIQTHSGGPGAAAADACGRAGLELPSLRPETVEGLRHYVPHTASIRNPVDLTFSRNPQDYFGAIPDTLLQDGGIHALLFYYHLSPGVVKRALQRGGTPPEQLEPLSQGIMASQAQALVELAARSPKPVVVFTYRDLEDLAVQRMVRKGLPVFEGAERAVRALWALNAYGKVRRSLVQEREERDTLQAGGGAS